ncbi:coiled-coil domain-containing protein 81 [Onychostruthus taczanowskii]|uniref:coiled-coil domain-containing protein 81 n=1 Tax=Onychostruthus taczanowskii TaxID=356909 RepID=UPI001B80BCBD|nr:coiled-coil domain-containing protein 81 [Onychostruthus taczanowskii]
MPSITPTAETQHNLVFPCFPERKAVWDAVASNIQQQLLLHKGIRIPTLGSFDVVHTETLVGNKTVILQRPVFHLARNLGGVQNLENKDDLAGGKQLEPLKYAKVATQASVSRKKVECCILGTMSLLHHCLEKGMSVAFVLRDVGVLLIEGSMVLMRFYLDFLEKVTGERIQDRATLKALQQLDIVVSRVVPVASLSFSGHVIIFPKKLPVISGAAARRKQPVADQDTGKPVPNGQELMQSNKEADAVASQLPMLKKREMVARGPWPWVE